MFGKVRLSKVEGGCLLTLTPTQLELIRRVLIHTYGDGSSVAESAILGRVSTALLEIRKIEVDFRARERARIHLSDIDLRMVWGALAFAFMNRSSEEAFHIKYGFYSENVQTVARAISEAFHKMEELHS